MEATERRVRRPSAWSDLLDELNSTVFASYADALTFAACLGYSKGRRKPFEKSDEPIRMTVFETRGHGTIPDFLALAEEKDAQILADDRYEDRVLIFEEYANGGLEVISSRVEEHFRALDAILALVAEAQVEEEEEDLGGKLRRLVEG